MKILNLYAGIGGNRKLWGDKHKITAIENNPKIAKIHQDFFPNDTMIVTDAHQYLLEHFKEYDFIWSSRPCLTHSKLNTTYSDKGWKNTIEYPDMGLYQEIIILKHFFKGKYCVENVIPYYKPLIPAQEIHKHCFWANFHISSFPTNPQHFDDLETLYKIKGFDLTKYSLNNKRQIMRNCVNPYLGLHILNESKRDIQGDLFK